MGKILGILLAVGLLLAGTLRSGDSAVERDIKQTAKDTGQLVHETKEEFLKRVEKVDSDFGDKIGQLEKRAARADRKADASVDRKLRVIRLRWKALDKKLVQLRKSSGETWDRLKVGVDKAVDDLKKAYDDIVSTFSE